MPKMMVEENRSTNQIILSNQRTELNLVQRRLPVLSLQKLKVAAAAVEGNARIAVYMVPGDILILWSSSSATTETFASHTSTPAATL
jgi:hypothetical protein